MHVRTCGNADAPASGSGWGAADEEVATRMCGGADLGESGSDPARKRVAACMQGRPWPASAGVEPHFCQQAAGKRLKVAIYTQVDTLLTCWFAIPAQAGS
jgi:hypothetical protein